MTLKLGSTIINKLWLGSNEIKKSYLGSILVYDKTAIALWTPTQLGSSLNVWLDASDASSITLNGSSVSQLNDKSGNNRNLSQGVLANQPIYNATGFNNRPAIVFDGTDDFLKNANYQPAGALTLFIVYNSNALGVLVNVQRSNGVFEVATTPRLAGYPDIVFTATGSGSGNGYGVDAISDGLNQNNILAVQYDGAGYLTTDYAVRLNGSSQTVLGSGALGYVAETGFTIGGRPIQNIPVYYNGAIAELIFSESQLSVSDNEKIEGYLAHKWDLTANLPVNHPYKTTPPTV